MFKKSIRNIVMIIVSLLIIIPISASAKDLVKVYIFEAGGCPYCEAEISYLKGLDSYNKKFTIVEKELYIDHVDWKEGADYDLGVKVANAFYNAGFTDATYTATPFVVISNLYAAAAYSTDLESIIEEAYEAGDQDVVSAIANGDTDVDIPQNTSTTTDTSTDTTITDSTTYSSSNNNTDVMILILVCFIGYLVKSTIDKRRILKALGVKEDEEE